MRDNSVKLEIDCDYLDTSKFVDEIFDKYNPKPQETPAPALPAASQAELPPPETMDFNQPISQPVPQPFMTPTFNQGNIPPANIPGRGGFENGSQSSSRKRGFQDISHPGPDQGGYQRGADRPFKSQRGRRGFRGGSGGWDGRQSGPQNQAGGYQGAPVPPGFPPFDPNNPLSQMLAMGFPQMPGMPPMPPLGQYPNQAKIAQRCKDYDTLGYCVLASSCPYQHGTELNPAANGKINTLRCFTVMRFDLALTLIFQSMTPQNQIYCLIDRRRRMVQVAHGAVETGAEDGAGDAAIEEAIHTAETVPNSRMPAQMTTEI